MGRTLAKAVLNMPANRSAPALKAAGSDQRVAGLRSSVATLLTALGIERLKMGKFSNSASASDPSWMLNIIKLSVSQG